MAKAKPDHTTVCTNKKASFRFELLEKLDCGVVLDGSEVKSLRESGASLEESYARITNGELWLIGCHIGPYRYSAHMKQEPLRKRKLLAHAAEIRKWLPRVEQKGLTLVPTRIFFNERGIAKVTIALARGKTIGDKRQTVREREDRREIERATRRKR